MTTNLIDQFAACSAGRVCLDSLPHTTADNTLVQTIITVVVGIVAAVSLLFIVIGGFRYILSQGDPQGVSKAKSTIVFALIGLVVAILAQVLVSFVVTGLAS